MSDDDLILALLALLFSGSITAQIWLVIAMIKAWKEDKK